MNQPPKSSSSSSSLRCALFLLLTTIQPQSTTAQCDPCAAFPTLTGFKIKPDTACKEYVQCISGANMGDFQCNGDTIFDESAQYCNWPASVTCVDAAAACPPTGTPAGGSGTSTDNAAATPTATPESANCSNPCPLGFTGFKTVPGTSCSKYVQCDNGAVAAEMECFGGTIFNIQGQYCDFETSTTCAPAPCPSSPATAPPGVNPPTAGGSIDLEDIINDPSSVDDDDDECRNPCPLDYSGLLPKPETMCKMYVQCNKGKVFSEFECFESQFFNTETGTCADVLNGSGKTVEMLCPPTPCPDPPPTEFPTWMPTGSNAQSSSTEEGGQTGTTSNPPAEPSTQVPLAPSTPEPTFMPTSLYQNFRYYLLEREESFNTTVFVSQNGKPSTAYTWNDFLNSLDVVVYQLPPSKMFFVGQETMIDDSLTQPGVDGRSSVVRSYGSIHGMQYGLINLAAFLSNAMVEGIRINSCNELNTDDIDGLNERYPLSNACGQYGRSYSRETCAGAAESFHCKLDNKMQLNAGEVVGEVRSSEGGVEGYVGAPPFMCRPKEEEEDFTGFYDVVVKEVVNSVFANTPGRTDVEGCCWWGRGVLLTRGRCTIGRLNYYLAKQASDEGFYSRYPDIDLCTVPNAICNDVARTRELRWVLGLFEWVDKVQSYDNDLMGWNYMDQLKKFYDGGMRDDDFITKVTNIFTRGCHDGLCAYNDILFETERKDNFKKIINEIFNLPLTRRPTPQPISPAERVPTTAPTKMPTSPPTRKKKAKQKEVLLAIPDSSSLCLRCRYRYLAFSAMLSMFFFV